MSACSPPFRRDRVPLDAVYGTVNFGSLEVADFHSITREYGRVAIGEEEYVARMIENRRHIQGEEVLALPIPTTIRRTRTRRHDFVRLHARTTCKITAQNLVAY